MMERETALVRPGLKIRVLKKVVSIMIWPLRALKERRFGSTAAYMSRPMMPIRPCWVQGVGPLQFRLPPKTEFPAPWSSGLNGTVHNNPKRRRTKRTPVPMRHINSSGVRPTSAHRLNPRGTGSSQKVAERGSSPRTSAPLRKGTSMASLGAWDNWLLRNSSHLLNGVLLWVLFELFVDRIQSFFSFQKPQPGFCVTIGCWVKVDQCETNPRALARKVCPIVCSLCQQKNQWKEF